MVHHMQGGDSPATWTKDVIMNQKYSHFDNKKKQDAPEWDEPAEKSHKIYVRIISFLVAVIFIAAAVYNFKFLGGIEGILSFEMLEVEGGMIEYVSSVSCLILFPIIAVIGFVKAFKKEK